MEIEDKLFLVFQRLTALEDDLRDHVALQDNNVQILQESIAHRSIENTILRRIIADLDHGVERKAYGVYRTPEGDIDFSPYEAEYLACQGLQGFVEAHKEWQQQNPDPEPDADYVFGD